MPDRILVVDDDPDILEVVAASLAAEGFVVSTAGTADLAMTEIRTRPPALVILDVMMESHDTGHQLCGAIREEHDVPIIFLTARATEIDAVVGLELGADDYMTKPFRPRELGARVRAVLRRSSNADDSRAPRAETIGGFLIDPTRLEMAAPGGTRSMSRIEFLILQTLSARPGVVFNREQLIAQVYGGTSKETSPRTIDSHIRRLRAKMNDIGTDCIETVRGVGYRLSDP